LERRPLRILCPLTLAAEQSKRSANSIDDISRLTSRVGIRNFTETFSATFMARAVFPMLGRPARIINSELCSPPVSESNSVKPVSTPPLVCSPLKRASSRSIASCMTSRMLPTVVVPRRSRMAKIFCSAVLSISFESTDSS